MKFINPLPFVTDIDRAKRFYSDILQMRILEDHGAFVRFESGFALHEGAALHQTVFGTVPAAGNAPYGRCNLVLYFEDEDIDAVFERISGQVQLIHGIETQAWGQRVFRFFDPDGHIVEIGEPM